MGDAHGPDNLPGADGFETRTASAQPASSWPQPLTQALDHTPPSVPRDVPQILGYDIISVLGRGGMGLVYRALQTSLQRTVALKMAASGGHAGPEVVTRFRAEAAAIAGLQHPNIVQVYEIGECQGLPFFSLEYCAGGSLADRLRDGPLPTTDAAKLVETLARAVAAAHRAGIIHRDLKPANVLFTADGTPKIADFGLAKMVDQTRLTLSGAVLGTPCYMAPEQARGEVEATGPAADVYALGAILYECLAGRPPFKGASAHDTIARVIADEPEPPSRHRRSVPRDLETVCLKCLEKDPGRRYPSAEALADDLRRFNSGEPIQARPVGRTERLIRRARRNPVVVGLAAAVVVLAGVLAFGVMKSSDGRVLPPEDSSSEELLQVVAELDRLEPGWRLEQIEAAREEVPEAENAAVHVRAVTRLLPADWPAGELARTWSNAYELSPASRFEERQVAALREELQKRGPAVAEGLRLADKPRGRHAVKWSRDGLSTLVKHAQDCRPVATLLGMEAAVRSHDGDADGALTACRAVLNSGRSVGTEPIFVSQLVRQALLWQSVRIAERVLAHGEPSDPALVALQQLLEDEATHPALRIGARGDRGGLHWAMSAFEAGDLRPEHFQVNRVGEREATAGPMPPAALRRAHIWLLRDSTRFVRFADLSDPEIAARHGEWDKSARDIPPEVRQLELVSEYGKVYRVYLRAVATARCAATAIAVFRYRQSHGRWPDSLSELVGQGLRAVPADPYDGQPLRYRRLADGVVVYAVGPDRVDDGGVLDYKDPERLGGDVGVRLWNVARRMK
jgi:serine/threonine protein kinase